MKIPLLVLANPRNTCLGPRVLLPEGDWEIEHNIVDSEVVLVSPNSPTLGYNILQKGMRFSGGKVNISVLKPGTETSISISAIKCQ